jgi:hypothetical protein
MRGVTLILVAALCHAEIVDRVAANIGLQVITDADVVNEARMQAFIDGAALDLSPAHKRRVLDRLIEQSLVRKELEFARFAPVPNEEVEPLLKQILAQHSNFAEYYITLDQLRAHVAWTLTMLRFIEYRFQPGVQISEREVRQEYRRRTAELREKPPLDELRPELEKIIRQRLIDAALDRWLGEARTQTTIVYHNGYQN